MTFAGAVGNTTALTSFASAAGSTTAINGGLMRTTGTQTYDGALVDRSADHAADDERVHHRERTGQRASGTLTFVAGTGAVSMLNPLNDFGTVAIHQRRRR